MHSRRYSAFISYRHADNTQEGRRWAEWLHRGLERYVVPPDLIGTPNLRDEPIRDSLYPIFRDEDELPANADLATGIRAALEVSDHLIVLASPRSAVSPWVRKEVREFKELGRSDRILAIIIAGEPNADDPAKAREGILRDEECFCEELRFGAVRDDGTLDWTIRTEPLAADLRPGGTRAEGFVTAEAYREHLTLNSSLTPDKIATRTEAYRQQLDHALLKVAAGLLGVPLGQLMDRDAAHRAAETCKELARAEAVAARLRLYNTRLIGAGLVALCLAAFVILFWWRAREDRAIALAAQSSERHQRELLGLERDEQARLLQQASDSAHEDAIRSLDGTSAPACLPYFDRALTFKPDNRATLVASANIAAGTCPSPWRQRAVSVHTNMVKWLRYLPDSKSLAVYCADSSVARVDAVTGRLIWTARAGLFPGDADLSSDGRWLAIAGTSTDGGQTGVLKLFDMGSGEIQKEVIVPNSLGMIRFSPDGSLLVTGGKGDSAWVIETVSGNVRKTIKGEGEFRCCAFSADGSLFALGFNDKVGSITTFRSADLSPIQQVPCDEGVWSLTFSPENFTCLAAIDYGAMLFDAASGTVTWKTSQISNPSWRTPVRFSPDGSSCSAGWGFSSFDTKDGRQLIKGAGDVQDVMLCDYSPDGRFALLTGSRRKALRVIEASSGLVRWTFDVGENVWDGRFSPDGGSLAVCSTDRTVRIFEPNLNGTIDVFHAQHNPEPITWSPDGRFIGVNSKSGSGEVSIIDAITKKELVACRSRPRNKCLEFSPDSKLVAAGFGDGIGGNGAVALINADERRVAWLNAWPSEVTDIAFDPAGDTLVVTSRDRLLNIIDVSDARVIRSMKLDLEPHSVCYSPNGHNIVVGCSDGMVLTVDASTCILVHRVRLANEPIWSVRYSPDGTMIAAGSRAKTAWILDTQSLKKVYHWDFDDGVNQLRFSPNGRLLGVKLSPNWRFIVIDLASRTEIHHQDPMSVSHFCFDGSNQKLAESSAGGLVRILDTRWWECNDVLSPLWQPWLRTQSGCLIQDSGRRFHLDAETLAQAFDQSKPLTASGGVPAGNSWQLHVLSWLKTSPDLRTTSPWTNETLRAAAGKWFMSFTAKRDSPPSIFNTGIQLVADEAPWHPLEPVSLARLAVRPRFLARLTLKRLHDAGEKLYGRDTLAEYAAWSAKIMREELHLDAEALEALTFALERTPPEKQSELLELKAKLEAK